MGAVGEAPKPLAGELHLGLLQHPEGQQGFCLVPRQQILGVFRLGQHPAGQLGRDPAVQLLGVQPYRALCQDAGDVTGRVGDGKTVRAARKIGAACFGNPDRRQSLPRLLPVELRQQLPPGGVACPAGQAADGKSHTSMIPSSPSDRSLPSFSRSQAIRPPRTMTTRPSSTITSREVVMGSTMSTAPMRAETMA